IEAHHNKNKGAGTAYKGTDLTATPLCYWHHCCDFHQHGKESFEDKHGIVMLREILKTLMLYIVELEKKK
ncbi:hypothetical protein KAR91_13325, partial [Candidatus Pacearchaeota archaeon]|nr:hypothetical protein [Candidatus Pacearchaeota archaeon]